MFRLKVYKVLPFYPETFIVISYLSKIFKKIYLFLERGEGRERNIEWLPHWLPLVHPQLGNWPITQACAPTGN